MQVHIHRNELGLSRAHMHFQLQYVTQMEAFR